MTQRVHAPYPQFAQATSFRWIAVKGSQQMGQVIVHGCGGCAATPSSFGRLNLFANSRGMDTNRFAPRVKRFVDLVDRGPEDDTFFPAASNATVFRRPWKTHHNVVPEIVEIGYQGDVAWGQRITVRLTRQDSGDLLQWVCLRLRPASWLGPALERKITGGGWEYADLSGAWMWADSLGSVAIQRVELEIGDTLVDSWPGEWMDIWSRLWLDLGRAPGWDADMYGKLPTWVQHDVGRPAWTTVSPTEDGYVYCWLPLAFLRRTATPFPLVALADSQEMRLHITLRPFADVVRRRLEPRTSPTEVPLGQIIVVNDVTGATPIPYEFRLPLTQPGFHEVNVFAGVALTEDPLRSSLMRLPQEIMYEPVTHMRFDVPTGLTRWRGDVSGGCAQTAHMTCVLDGLNGPQRKIIFFLRRRAVWQYNEWTNYGALLEPQLNATVLEDADGLIARPIAQQVPLLAGARLSVGNAIWNDDDERWWRIDFGLEHRGGVRAANGMVYGFEFGSASNMRFEDLQPAGTVNASRAEIKLDLDITVPPPAVGDTCDETGSEWEIHVFGVGLNWMRFVNGMAVPLFKD